MIVYLEPDELLALLKVLDFGKCNLPLCSPKKELTQAQIDYVTQLTKIQIKLQKVADKLVPPAGI